MEVGARDAPTARHVLALMSNTSLESVAPMASGTSEPKNATCTPLAPTNDSDARSTSTPASKTMSTRPNSPTIISASGFGAMFMPWGPTAMPARISPTNWGWTVGDGTVSSTARSAGKVRMGAVRYSRGEIKGWGTRTDGSPSRSAHLPTTQNMSRMPQNATSSSNVNGTVVQWGRGKGG